MTGDLKTANSAGLNGLLFGASIGGVYGAGAGYLYKLDYNNSSINDVVEQPKMTPQAKGEAGVNRAIEEIKAQGGKILSKEVTLEVGNVRVRIDVAADFNGVIHLYEVKNGPHAGFTPNQKVGYPLMKDATHIPIVPKGNNAIQVWGKEQIGQPTLMYKFEIIQYK